jgi:hypothetical protein
MSFVLIGLPVIYALVREREMPGKGTLDSRALEG